MSYCVFLNSSNEVVAKASVSRSVAEVQVKNSSVITKISPLTKTNWDQVVSIGFTADTNYYHKKTSGDGTDISHYSQVVDLKGLKTKRLLEIDGKTSLLIAQGVGYGGKQFSLSAYAQTNWIGMFTAKDYLTYPITISTLNDANGTYDLATSTDVTYFYLAAVAKVKEHLDSGRNLKELINNAVTESAINGIIDTREFETIQSSSSSSSSSIDSSSSKSSSSSS